MTLASSITLLATPWSVVVALAALVATCALSFEAWRRSGYRRSVGALELVRVLLVAAIGLLLNQPEWIAEYRPDEKPTIAVLWDDSASMATRDVVKRDKTGAPEGAPVTRRDSIAPLASQTAWAKLAERFDVVIQPFAATSSDTGTDLFDPLAGALEKVPRLRAVVLASDGDWNAGKPPVEAAARLRLREVPVVAVPSGRSERLPDVELASLDAPTFAVAGKSVRIPFTIDSSLPRPYLTTVTLHTGDGEEVVKEVRIAPQGRTSDYILWKPADVGDYTLSLEVPRHGDEALSDNNKLSAPLSIREEKLRVLVVESLPRWEYRYLRNALSRDPGVELSCLLFHPGLGKVGGGNKDYIKEFPAGKDALAKFDVVFLGDVGLDEGQLAAEQCRMLRGLVEQQASGLVFMPGMEGRQFTLLESELADLYPVVLDDAQPGGWGSRLPCQFELTASGDRSLLTKLADTPDENADVWQELPGFQWHAPVVRAKAGAEVLCVHHETSNEFGRIPLLVTQTFGAGKVLFMGTDGAWRWRKGVEDKYHYRFWSQVVRWMAYRRHMAEGESMRLYYTPDQPAVRRSIALSANVMEPSGEPLARGEVTARIVAPSGAGQTLRLTAAGEEWGAFAGTFVPEEPGKHRVALSCPQTGGMLETSFFVRGAAREPVGRPARPEVLEEIARVTGGEILAADQLDKVIDYVAALPEPPPAIRRLQFWSHPAVAGVMICLLGVFWVGRKAAGLI